MIARRLAAALCAIVLVACSPKRPHRSSQSLEREVTMIVNNNYVPPVDLTVILVSEGGQRTTLGTAPPSSTRTLRYRPAGSTQRYYLLGRTASGQGISSQDFTFQDVGVLTWTLRQNTLEISDTP